MAELFTNNATTTLAAALAPAGTSITVQAGDGTKFPNPTAPDFFRVVLFKKSAGGTGAVGQIEICICTARAVDILTITRAQEGTAAIDFSTGDLCELRPTAGFFNSLAAVSTTTIQQDLWNYGVDTSISANTITFALSPAIAAHVPGMPIRVKVANSVTGVTQINPGPGLVTVKKYKTQDLGFGDMLGLGVYELIYDGTFYQLISGVQFAGGNLTGALNEALGGTVTIAAGVADISGIPANYLGITAVGNPLLTSFGTVPSGFLLNGSSRKIQVNGQFILPNSATIQTPTGGNIQTVIGDVFEITYVGAAWNVYNYTRKSGTAVTAVPAGMCNTVAGTDAITANCAAVTGGYVDGQRLQLYAAGANVTTTPSINIGGIGAIGILKGLRAVLLPSDIPGAGYLCDFEYNATIPAWILLNPAPSSGSFTGTLGAAGLTEFTTAPTGTFYYDIVGNICTLTCPILTATSNAAGSYFTITGVPSALMQKTSGGTLVLISTVYDNGGTFIGNISTAGSNSIRVYKNNGAAFTASGLKGIYASSFTYSLV